MTKRNKLIALLMAFISPFISVLFANAQSPESSTTWDLSGNASTTSSNFLGTTDYESLRFKINSVHAGIIDVTSGNTALGESSQPSSSGSYNTSVGYWSQTTSSSGGNNSSLGTYSLQQNQEGNNNVAVGSTSLYYNADGSDNVGVGVGALSSNVSGNKNVAVGFGSLGATTADELVAIGSEALYNNSTGRFNTAIGTRALMLNTTNHYNVAVGYEALMNSAAGDGGVPNHNTAVGTQALYSNTVGGSNTSMGYKSMYLNVSGGGNVAIGQEALYSNVDGVENTAGGLGCLGSNTTGIRNTALGRLSLFQNTTGIENVAIGNNTLAYTPTGDYNTAVGSEAFTVSGSYNSALGSYTHAIGGPFDNTTAIGYDTHIDGSDQVHIGDYNVTEIEGQVNFFTYSDARYKRNVQENVPGLEFIKKIRPVTYTVDVEGIGKHREEAYLRKLPADKREEIQKQREKRKIHKNPRASEIVYTGFLAQEVEKTAKELNYDFSGVGKPKNDDDLYSLGYSDFIPPIFKAIQEQQLLIDKLNEKVETLERLLRTQGSGTGESNKMELEQNNPNPFSNNTKINYSIDEPGEVTLLLLNSEGHRVRDLEKATKMKGHYEFVLDGSGLNPGIYYYVLKLNGEQLTKKAIKL